LLAHKPIRILRIIARLNIGGPAIQAIMLSSDLPRDQYHTLLACGSLSPGEGDMSYLARERNVRPLIIKGMGREISFLRDIRTLLELRRIIQRFKPHVIHTHTAKAGTLGRLAALSFRPCSSRNSIRLVHTFHGHVFHSYFSPIKTRFFILLEKFLARFTDRIIAISDLQKKDICDRFKIATKEKVEIFPLGFDLSLFKDNVSDREVVRKKYFHKDLTDIFIAGLIGRLTPIKNHLMLFKAIAHLKSDGELNNFRFLIIGDGELREILMDIVRVMNIQEYVVFTGWQKDMVSIYSALDIVVLTSKNEGTPVTLIEAMAASKVIISTRVGGVPDLLGKVVKVINKNIQIAENGILIPSDNGKALADALLLVRDNRTEFNSNAHKASNYAVNVYSEERLLSDIKSLYLDLT
jgi:glycosyltransferase involved in cell wall biosynthesis